MVRRDQININCFLGATQTQQSADAFSANAKCDSDSLAKTDFLTSATAGFGRLSIWIFGGERTKIHCASQSSTYDGHPAIVCAFCYDFRTLTLICVSVSWDEVEERFFLLPRKVSAVFSVTMTIAITRMSTMGTSQK